MRPATLDVSVGQEVAGWVALAVGYADMIARTADDLAGMRAAMASRAVIDQAKGILDGMAQRSPKSRPSPNCPGPRRTEHQAA